MATRSIDGPWIEDWLSIGRFSPTSRQPADLAHAHSSSTNGSPSCAAFLHDLGHLEVGLRNARDRALAAATVPGDAHWTDPATLLTLFPVLMRRDRSTGWARDVNKIARGNVERAPEVYTLSVEAVLLHEEESAGATYAGTATSSVGSQTTCFSI